MSFVKWFVSDPVWCTSIGALPYALGLDVEAVAEKSRLPCLADLELLLLIRSL
jgi:hypothetical protein